MGRKTIRVWDVPTRVFHWALVACIATAVVTGLEGGGAMVWHGRAGLAVVGLVTFRIMWGVAGSTYARFCQFMPTLGKIAAYLRGQWQGAGHNPLGALSVFALLAMSLAQAVSGLFGNDDIAFKGYLTPLVSSDLSLEITAWHRLGFWVLVALVGLHVASIIFYAVVKKHRLVPPMITGKAQVPEDSPAQDARGGGIVAFIVAVAIAVAAVYAASGAFVPPPPPPVETPSW